MYSYTRDIKKIKLIVMGGGDTTDALILPRAFVYNTLASLNIFENVKPNNNLRRHVCHNLYFAPRLKASKVFTESTVIFYVSCEIYTTDF